LDSPVDGKQGGDAVMKPLDLSTYRNIVVLTGAGISVASGIRPFRGPGGLWNDDDVALVVNRATAERDPQSIWRLFGPLRTLLRTAQPNPAHQVLARVESRLKSDQQFLLVTQNIDGLHQRAGSRNVVELHGAVRRSRCSDAGCVSLPFEDDEPHADRTPVCATCGGALRLDIVLFDEQIPVEAAWPVQKALRECDLFIAIGTSGTVAPACNFVRSASYAGAQTIFVNLEPMEPRNHYFQEEYLGPAEEVLPALLP
jgi:NAD-dependent deacetylase